MNALRITNGLILDFTLAAAGGSDAFLLAATDGTVKSLSSVPVSRVSGGGNLTESTSSVLTITGGTAAILTSSLTIQVKQATTGQAGYLSSTDWNTFNNKLGTSLTSAYLFVGNGSNVATGVPMSGNIAIDNTGATTIQTNVITNAMVNSAAGITFSKMAALTPSLVTATNGSGFITTVMGFTTTVAGYLVNVTSDVQAQLNGKLSVTLTSPASGDVITYNGTAWVNSATGTGTLPTGGTANQFLTKINATNYNTQWHTLVAADITDVTSSAAELNKLTGVTTTTAQFNYLNTTTSDVQTQINNKLANSLANNALFIGNASNVPSVLAAGSNGQVLQIAAGVPTWQTISGTGTVTSIDVSGGTTGLTFSGGPVTTTGTITMAGTLALANGGTGASLSAPLADNLWGWDNTDGAIKFITIGGGLTYTHSTHTLSGLTNTAAANEIMKSDGTNAVPSGLLSSTLGNITLGLSGTSGTSRTVSVDGSGTNIGLGLSAKGTGNVQLTAGTSGGGIVVVSYGPLGGSGSTISSTSYSGSAFTNSTVLFRVSNQTTGTAAVGIGTGIVFNSKNSSTFIDSSTIESISTNIGAGTEAFDLVLKNMTGGAAASEKLRILASGAIAFGGSTNYGTSGQVLVSAGSGASPAWTTISGTLYTQTAYKTIANTLTETTILNSTVTLPANFFAVGKIVRMKLTGIHSATGTPNITIKIKLGSTVVLTTGAVNSSSSTNAYADIDATISCYTTGATGTVSAQGFYREMGGGVNDFPMDTTATATIDTTASQVLDVTVTWGTASTSNTITFSDGYIEFKKT